MAGQSSDTPIGGIIDDPTQAAPGFEAGGDVIDPSQALRPDPDKEEKLVKKQWKTYEDARKFDDNFRKQIAIDRRYAAGTSDLAWAVTTNLIGAFIDILVALLYAKDPDVSVKKAEQVDDEGTQQMDDFAKTLQIVIGILWDRGKLKKSTRRAVRSVLSNSEGWLKCMMVSEKDPQPEVQAALNDAKELHGRLDAQMKLLEDPGQSDPDTIAAEMEEKAVLIADLEQKLELAVNKMFVIDYAPTENIQVSTDVQSIGDYLDADWISNEMFVGKDDALARFPRLKAEDLKDAKIYYQKGPKELTTRDTDNILPQGQVTAETAMAFTQQTSESNSPQFYRVIEKWDRTDKQVRTLIEGLKIWAKEPYEPPYPTSRFYPYFYFCFYEVDGERHPQSLAWRLYKLQDEYSSVRSNFRIARERSVPAVLFNATALSPSEAKKLSDGKIQEFIGLNPATPDTPLGNLFAPKPVAQIDMRVYDPSYILSDMERLSGVQEALSAAMSGPGNPRTATEANIQQSGTNARTSADRDQMEGMLEDLATYTAEQALQCLTIQEVQRMAGQKAFWPQGMSIEDLFQLVQIDIEAGSTGKPRQGSDQQAWAQLLPIIQNLMTQIRTAFTNGDQPMAQALIALLKETMIRSGDQTDPDRFIPKENPTPPPSGPPAPQVSISLRGELDPITAKLLASPDLPPPPAPPQAGPGAPPPPPGAAPPSPIDVGGAPVPTGAPPPGM